MSGLVPRPWPTARPFHPEATDATPPLVPSGAAGAVGVGLLMSSQYVCIRVAVWLAAHAACVSTCRSHRLPLVVRPLRRLPALSLLPGHIPAQLARWPAVGN